MPLSQKLVAFTKRDRVILRALARRLHAHENEVIRCAVRWYALGGPWRDGTEDLLQPLRGVALELQVIPTRKDGI